MKSDGKEIYNVKQSFISYRCCSFHSTKNSEKNQFSQKYDVAQLFSTLLIKRHVS